MKSLILFLSLISSVVLAQQPQWMLVRENIIGVIAVDPTNSSIIYINGVHKTTDGGLTWQVNSQGFGLFRPYDVIVDPNNPQVIYVCGDGLRMGVVKSCDDGLTWTKSDTGIVPDHHDYTVRAMALDAKRNILYAGDLSGGGGMYRSLDGAAHWELLSTSGFNAIDMLVDQEQGTVYVATYQGVRKSEDQGKIWNLISTGLPIASINPFTGDTLYAIVWSIAKIKQSKTLYAAVRDNGIYKSYNMGKNWFSMNDSLTQGVTVRSGIVASEIDTNVVYIGNWGDALVNISGGVLSSVDGGKNWKRVNTGLPSLPLNRISVFNLAINNASNTLYGTFGLLYPDSERYSLYKLNPATITTVKERKEFFISDYDLFQNYPNPFNSETQIRYRIKNRSFVKLSIYDITGKEVIELLSSFQSPGEYHINWNGKHKNGGNAPSGIYFIQLEAKSFTQIRKMLIIR
ncbi:MAG: T9SS type A sorting domain-containing protein [Anaerolineae bacterium]|nr:T9SS type A sorting domain-containing protein [Anaerolineae bacterium]MCI0692855.1 T9SS type A sorting domain-containing protein [candidate division KSB1 bacterium]